MYENFGVALRGELMTQGLQILSQATKVIDLSIEYHPYRSIFVVYGLVSCFQVDDGEAAHRESDGPVQINACIIGSPVNHAVSHPHQHISIDRMIWIEIKNAGYRTH
jgi:hypothetical protein